MKKHPPIHCPACSRKGKPAIPAEPCEHMGKVTMQTLWFSQPLACGTRRQFLYQRPAKNVPWAETPYFVDSAPNHAHYTWGQPHGLYGSGMGELVESAKIPYRIAACFGGFRTVTEAKKRAIKLLADTTTKAREATNVETH